jgi:hypothetical protein
MALPIISSIINPNHVGRLERPDSRPKSVKIKGEAVAVKNWHAFRKGKLWK